jgi:hypothetical protein
MAVVLAWALPPTYVFEGMRALVIDHVFRADLMAQAFAFNGALRGCIIRVSEAAAERTGPGPPCKPASSQKACV